MKRTGAQIVWESLIQQEARLVFGYPGGNILPIYDALVDYQDRIRHILVRHEENAALAADGYARATGKVGVCMATSGPGATNLVTGLANAMMDSSPVVAITGQVASYLVGTDAFQEMDVTGVTIPVTKHNYLVMDLEELPEVLAEAFYVAKTGRPGPVLVDICRDVQLASMDYKPVKSIKMRGYRVMKPMYKQDVPSLLREATELIDHAKRPVILAGQGIKHANAHGELCEFINKTGIPVSTTLLGIGVLSEDHPLNLRMMGMHGEAYVNNAIANADLLIALGMRFDDRVTGSLSYYAKNANVIHVDIDAAEINKNVPADVPIVGNVKDVLAALTPLVAPNSHKDWLSTINEWREDTRARDVLNQDLPDSVLLAPHVIRAIWEATQGQCTVATDVGQHQMWEAQYFPHIQRNQLLTSGGLGSMGFALPAAIGAKLGRPDDEVWAIVGDGGFQMSMPEMGTIMQENLNIKIAVINNHYLGMVRQQQDLMCNKRYSQTDLWSPNFRKIADAYGMPGFFATTQGEAREIIAQARAHDGPVVCEFQVEREMNVLPMVLPGKALDDMARREPAALGNGFDTAK